MYLEETGYADMNVIELKTKLLGLSPQANYAD
jgi:hypothetical protein